MTTTAYNFAVGRAANMKLADVMAAQERLELCDEIVLALDADYDVTVQDGIVTTRPNSGHKW
jgi:hypothetical protein